MLRLYVYMKNYVSPEISNASVSNPRDFIFSENLLGNVFMTLLHYTSITIKSYILQKNRVIVQLIAEPAN